MKLKQKKTMKNENAITLIALVVTIVVLLILAGVSISMLGGENGIIKQANKSKESTEIGEEREYVDLAVQNIMLAKKANNSTTAISEIELQNEMNKTAGIGKTTVSTNEEGKLVVKYNNSNREYPVDPGDGEVEINWEEVLRTATKHPEQSDTNNNIGVGTDGKPVNMDLWLTRVIGDNEIALNGEDIGSFYDNSYIGDITEDGKIQGKVPQYIKIDGESEFRIVTDMTDTFIRCGLKQAPEVPSSVNNMNGTFLWCSRLATASEIPSSVEDMGNTFRGCSSLTGELIINANPSSYRYCLTDASTNAGTNLVLKGTSTKLQEILNTKSSNSNITLGE